MKRSPRNLVVWSAISLAVMFLGAGALAATPATQSPADAALADIGRLVGGEWHSEGSPIYHVFEWGVGNKLLRTRTYAEDGDALSSEGFWFWEPRESVLRGYSIDASGAFFAEMTTRFEDGVMLNDLETVAPDGTIEQWTGEWRFPDPDTYDWVLFKHTENGRERQFEMTFRRSGE